jgi:hypothetical protein
MCLGIQLRFRSLRRLKRFLGGNASLVEGLGQIEGISLLLSHRACRHNKACAFYRVQSDKGKSEAYTESSRNDRRQHALF